MYFGYLKVTKYYYVDFNANIESTFSVSTEQRYLLKEFFILHTIYSLVGNGFICN